MKRIALITGASSGLGRAFALELDSNPAEYSRLDEVWLVARRTTDLEALAAGFRNLTPKVITLDLAGPSALEKIEAELESVSGMTGTPARAGVMDGAARSGKADSPPPARQARLELLINNAGLGTYGVFTRTPLDRTLGMMDLDMRVLTELTWRCLPFMGRGSRILNVGSLAAFQPLGNFAVYGACKAYVRSFSTALGAELAPHGIKVCTLNPGSVTSGFAMVASGGARQEVLHGYPPGPVVRKGLAASRRGRWASMPRLVWKLKALAGFLAGPRLSAIFTARAMQRPQAGLLDRPFAD